MVNGGFALKSHLVYYNKINYTVQIFPRSLSWSYAVTDYIALTSLLLGPLSEYQETDFTNNRQALSEYTRKQTTH